MSSPTPLASQWNDNKNASVDWCDPEDVLANRFTFLQILLLHPQLEAHMRTHADEKGEARAVFMPSSASMKDLGQVQDAQKALLKAWQATHLLTLRESRWCRHCGLEGHTRRTCPQLTGSRTTACDTAGTVAVNEETTVPAGAGSSQASGRPTPSSKIMEKLLAHQQRIERLKLLEEKKKRSADSSAAGNPNSNNNSNKGGARRGYDRATPRTSDEVELFTDERRRGVICRLDAQFNIGFIRVPDLGEIKFFLSNADYGVKSMAVDDTIIFKVDSSRNYPIAIDVRPERPVITADDAFKFAQRCSRATQPIDIITMLLTHPHEWYEVLRHVHDRRPQNALTAVESGRSSISSSSASSVAYVKAVHAFVEMTTFVGNREPIHLVMLCKFLRMTVHSASEILGGMMPSASAAAGTPPFYPNVLHAALEEDLCVANALLEQLPRTPDVEKKLLYLSDQWIEVANYVVLLRQYTSAAVPRLQETADTLISFFDRRIAHVGVDGAPVANQRQLGMAVRRLKRALDVDDDDSSNNNGGGATVCEPNIIPSAAELSVPPPLVGSVFAPGNLPINGKDVYTTTEAFIAAQCRLLRADTFEATSRVMPASCYALPNYTPSAETLSDVEHARIFWKVRYFGRVTTRDRDFSNPLSHILQLSPKSAKANMAAQLHQGTTVFISTSPDKTCITDDEVFWGVVSSCDSHLLKAGMIVVAPCEHSTPFDKLEANLKRNERAGNTEASLLMETPIFMAGYESIMRALSAFLGPLSLPLPMASLIVGPQVVDGGHSHYNSRNGNVNGWGGGGGGGGSDDGAQSTAAAGNHALLGYIPSHCEHAFRELTKDVRARFTLDAGQDAVMRRLSTSKILLVQGPPGTGKSFIGCRVVETYVRYKQMVASGDILQKISVDMLLNSNNRGGGAAARKWDQLLPQVGPVVVITYKNHALDEFLVDLLDSGLWDSARPRVGQQLSGGAASVVPAASQEMFPRGRRLIRIGGRSREGRLDGHNLGAMMHTITANSTIKSLKERVYVLSQRLEKLIEQVHYLENGRVPRSHFDRWLTSEQRQTISFEDKDAWLRGEKYVGASTRRNPDSMLFLRILRTNIAAALAQPEQNKANAATAGVAPRRSDKNKPSSDGGSGANNEEDEDVSLSVFQEMKREDERREFNDALHRTYLSAEAAFLAVHPPTRPPAVPEELLSLWSLDPIARHEYYAYLVQQSIASKAKNCLILMDTIANVVQIRNHAIDEAKLALLRGADVVGLTTTGCAMNQNLLRSLRPSVLVVEEAAEVLEPQLLACMTDSLEQIVLIGDHYQLQPKVDTFLYEKVNHLNLSLFERLAARVPPIRLTDQRRMHPSISRLVRPFYDGQPLVDHESVLTRPFLTTTGQPCYDGVPGLAKRVFFWRHDYPEEEAPGSRSKVNMRETLMVKQVALHLVVEGVAQSSITVITPYLGQCRMLRSVMRMASLTEVRISTVDLFQGDESDVIILSMTRTEKLTEFIRMRNRLIVSCSRARFAMVMVGNDALLRRCAHWATVLETLDNDSCVGDKLPITHHARPREVELMEVKGTLSAASVAREIDQGRSAAAAGNPARRASAKVNTKVNTEEGEEGGATAENEEDNNSLVGGDDVGDDGNDNDE